MKSRQFVKSALVAMTIIFLPTESALNQQPLHAQQASDSSAEFSKQLKRESALNNQPLHAQQASNPSAEFSKHLKRESALNNQPLHAQQASHPSAEFSKQLKIESALNNQPLHAQQASDPSAEFSKQLKIESALNNQPLHAQQASDPSADLSKQLKRGSALNQQPLHAQQASNPSAEFSKHLKRESALNQQPLHAQQASHPSAEFSKQLKRESVLNQQPLHAQQASHPSAKFSKHLKRESAPNKQPLHDQQPSNTPTELSKHLEKGGAPFDERVESMMLLTNGLILTEAIASKKMNMSRMIIDLMIIGQLDDLVDWFEVLSSAKVDDKTVKDIEQLFDQLGPLHEVIHNGFKASVNTDVLNTAVSIMNKIGVMNEVVGDAQKFRGLLSEFQLQVFIEATVFNHLLESLIKLPDMLKAFDNVKDKASALDQVSMGIDLVTELRNPETAELWENTIKHCDMQTIEAISQYAKCGYVLNAALKGFKIPNTEEIQSLRKVVAVMDVLGVESSVEKWEKMIEFSKRLNNTMKQLDSIRNFNEKKNGAVRSIQNFLSLMTELEKLYSLSNEVHSVADALTVLAPIQEIVQQLRKSYNSIVPSNSGSANSSFISFLKYYEGLPNGMKSIGELSRRFGPSHGIPAQILKSKMAQRVEVIKSWVATISPIIEPRDAFDSIPHLLNVFSLLEKTLTTGIPQDLKTNLVKIEKYYQRIPSTVEISTAIDNLFTLISTFNKNNWKTDFVEIVSGYTLNISKPTFKTLLDVSHIASEFAEFASKVQTSINSVPTNHTEYEYEIYKVIKGMAGEIENGMKIVKKMQSLQALVYPDSDISKIKEKLKTSTKQIKLVLENQSYTSDEIFMKLDTSSLFSFSFSETNVQTIDSFTSSATKLTNAINPNNAAYSSPRFLKKEGVDSVGNLLKTLSTPRINATVIEQSDVIAKMLIETPSGYRLLNSIRPGAMNYQKFANGYVAFLNLKRMNRRKRNIENSKLVNSLDKIFEKVKPITPINKNDSSVFGLLRDFPSLISQLNQFGIDVKKIQSSDQLEAQRNLKDLMERTTTTDMMKIQLVKISHSLGVLDNKFTDKISGLVAGLQEMYAILTFIDCKKNPTHPNCLKGDVAKSLSAGGSSDDSTWKTLAYVCIGIFVVLGICCGGYWFWDKKSKEKKEQKRQEEEEKKQKEEKKRKLIDMK